MGSAGHLDVVTASPGGRWFLVYPRITNGEAELARLPIPAKVLDPVYGNDRPFLSGPSQIRSTEMRRPASGAGEAPRRADRPTAPRRVPVAIGRSSPIVEISIFVPGRIDRSSNKDGAEANRL